eukprot:CAMPEP_0115831908 /NCGR_PEP_ID=MMETSP0287-20121206/2380_1 /TAXON_ID=412157 /ORGANISM="Chrysochromulina rotalis, Strain UIO044" /LENGTH=216 /DNA_ID=CAMNT_0003285267 /DNA_START=9 /DNA_END=659 /DNA_ORIENTATION=+
MISLLVVSSTALIPTSPLASLRRSEVRLPRCAPTHAQLRGDDDPEDEDEQRYLDDLEQAFLDAQRSSNADVGGDDSFLRIQREAQRLRRGSRPPLRRRSTGAAPQFTREDTELFELPRTFRRVYDGFLERPGQPLILGSLALLVGFYLAGALSTVFGAAGFWEPTIALGPLVLSELITRRYYSRPMAERSQTLRLLNALKVGFLFGVTLDALKLAG